MISTLVEFLLYAIILIALLIASYKDLKTRLVPDSAAIAVFVAGSIYFFINSANVTDYLFYIFYASIPILIIGTIADSISLRSFKFADFFTIIIPVAVGLIIPGNFKLKYVIACVIFLSLVLIVPLIIKEKVEDNEDQTMSIGGADIKMIAALGPVLQEGTVLFLFITFLLAFIFMKVKRERNIYLIPFMFAAYTVNVIFLLYSNYFIN